MYECHGSIDHTRAHTLIYTTGGPGTRRAQAPGGGFGERGEGPPLLLPGKNKKIKKGMFFLGIFGAAMPVWCLWFCVWVALGLGGLFGGATHHTAARVPLTNQSTHTTHTHIHTKKNKKKTIQPGMVDVYSHALQYDDSPLVIKRVLVAATNVHRTVLRSVEK